MAAGAMNNMSANAVQATTQSASEVKQQILNEAMLHGINYTFFLSTLIAAIALILAFFIKRVLSLTMIITQCGKLLENR